MIDTHCIICTEFTGFIKCYGAFEPMELVRH